MTARVVELPAAMSSFGVAQGTARLTLRLDKPLPTVNRWSKLHYRARQRLERAIAEELWCRIIPHLPAIRAHLPLRRCAIHVERCTSGTPDHDAIQVKNLMDALCVPKARTVARGGMVRQEVQHKFGLSIIQDDNPEVVESLVVTAGKAPPGKGFTEVTITWQVAPSGEGGEDGRETVGHGGPGTGGGGGAGPEGDGGEGVSPAPAAGGSGGGGAGG